MVVLGFEPGPEPPAQRLQRVFGIDAATAQALLARVPATVQRGVSRVRAEYFRRALDAIGAQLEIRGPGGELIAAPAPPVPAAPPAPVAAPAPRRQLSVRPSAPTLQAMPAVVAQPIPPAPVPVFGWDEPTMAPAPAFVDANSPTLAQHGAVRAPEPPAAHEPARPSYPTVGPRAFNATLREAVPAPALNAPAQVHSGLPSLDVPLRAAPTAFGSAAGPFAPSALPQPSPASVRPAALGTSLDAPFAPAAAPAPFAPAAAPFAPPPPGAAALAFGWATPAALQPVDVPAPAAAPPWRDPSGVFDPPPPPRNRPLSVPAPAPGAAFALESNLALPGQRPAPGVDPARRAPVELDFSNPAPARFDPLAGYGAPAVPAAGAGITLDGARDALPGPVLQPWELPSPESMAEPIGVASSRPPVGRRRGGRPAEPIASARASFPRDTVATRPSGAGDALDGRVSPFSVPPRPSITPPPRPAVGMADHEAARTRSVTSVDARSFWESLGSAFVLPFTGAGFYWIFAIAAWSVVVGVLQMLSSFMFVFGMLVMFVAHTSLIAFACDYYRVCLWQPMVGEDTIDIAPNFEASLILNRYFRSGMHLSLFAIASQVPLIAWLTMSLLDGEGILDLLSDPLGWALFAFPYLYWPMGVAIGALANDSSAIWNLLAGFKAIARAPLEYTFIVVVGLLVLAVSWTVLVLFGSLLGPAGTVLSGTAGIPLALSHGIQGALMGHLARSRSEMFE